MNQCLEKLRVAISSATRNMSSEDLTRRPAEGKWSPAEVLEHLTLTYKGTARNLERSLIAGKPLGGHPTLKQRLVDILIFDLGYFPSGRQSPEAAKPKGVAGEHAVGEINASLANMTDVIQKCELKFGEHAFVGDHPILGPITMLQWRKFHWVHGRHHIKQIERMRKQ